LWDKPEKGDLDTSGIEKEMARKWEKGRDWRFFIY
jgi:hypothetical protein